MGVIQPATIRFLGQCSYQAHVCISSRSPSAVLAQSVKQEVALTNSANRIAKAHLLSAFSKGLQQEHLCFGLWHSSEGSDRFTAIVNEVILPQPYEVRLHGNASFEGKYLTRAVREAKSKNAGLAMMHSHPSGGWQDLSQADTIAERDIVAYQAQATKKPFVGLTIGTDGYWSARFWTRIAERMELSWCDKVRVPRRARYQVDWRPRDDNHRTSRLMQRRTIETWGVGVQNDLERLRIGIVGLGSVGAIVAEAMARIGISQITLIDPDRIELHNLDRFIYGTKDRVGEFKVHRVKRELLSHTTNDKLRVLAIPDGIECYASHKHALDCDFVFSCVDTPLARDVLNHIAIAHAIPVLDAGVAVELNPVNRSFESARWRSHMVVPGNACLRCTGQYTSSDVVAELDGSLNDPSYIQNLPQSERPRRQNVFPFSLGCASMQTNLMIRYLIGADWWPTIQRQEYRLVSGRTTPSRSECRQYCVFRKKQGTGDNQLPHYLRPTQTPQGKLVSEGQDYGR